MKYPEQKDVLTETLTGKGDANVSTDQNKTFFYGTEISLLSYILDIELLAKPILNSTWINICLTHFLFRMVLNKEMF
jgi:hypothetical protein